MHKYNGYTLIELMITVAILSILYTVALPNFKSFLVGLKVDNEISSLYRILIVARNYAINSEQAITVCPLDDNFQCCKSWQNNIAVFLDANENKTLDINETLIAFKKAIPSKDKLLYSKISYRIVYAPTGRLTSFGSNGTFRFCPDQHYNKARAIRVATSGRIYQSSDIDNDGKDEIRDKTEISCL